MPPACHALGSADGGIYSADSSLKSFLCGLHYTFYPEENKNWIRTQATFFHNSGDTNFTMPTDTNTITGKSPNKSNGFYLAVNAGMSNQLSAKNELHSEIGLSYLKMSDAPKIHWGVWGESVPGYDMKFEKYNALYATAKTSLIHKFTDGEDDSSLLFSLGVRGRLSDKKLKSVLVNSKSSCDEEFFRLTRRKRDGVVSYVEREATKSGGKRTVTVEVYQQPLS